MNQLIPRATLYVILPDSIRDYGYQRIEALDVHHEIIKYAQYRKAVRVDFIPKGKRKPVVLVLTDEPALVILDGWGHPEVRDSRQIVESSSDIIVYTYRHPFSSQEWRKEFDTFFEKYLKESSSLVLADYRQHDTEEIHATVTLNESFVALLLPEEIPATETFLEGATRQIVVNAYERHPEARQKCINYYGTSCSICKLNFSEKYGEVGEGFIHVHHLKPLSEIGEQYEVDAIHDLRPVCPNCHAIIHKRTPPYSIEEVREFIAKAELG